jgi:DNA-binding NtrC family response regulator
MGGVAMVRTILGLDAQANVIFMSGYSMTEVVPEDLRELCSIIAKPFTAVELLTAVKGCR